MTLVTIDITDVVGDTPTNGRVAFYSPSNRGVGGRIISTAVKYADLVDGKAEIELVPGPVAVQISAQGISDTRVKPGFVPDVGPVSLPDVILKWTPPLIDQGVLAVLAAVEGTISRIGGAASEAVASEVAGFNIKVDEALMLSSTAESVARNAVSRLSALELREGLAPESPVDGQTANLVAQPGTLTRDEIVRATAAPSIMSVASSVVAKNLANGALPPMMPLLTGSPDEVIPNFSIQDPAENVPCPTRRDRTVWRIVGRGTGESTIRADRVMPAETNIMPASALSAWVYLPDPSKITRATLIVTGADGAWNRSTTDYETQEFHEGWNLVRFPTHTSAHQYLDKITQISVRVYYAGDGTDVEVLFGPLVAEKRPKASLVVINDWGSKEFYDNAYPLLKAAGIPVTWALRVNKLGDNSTPPNGHITLEQARALMWENNNVVSFHSWQGNATLGLTAQEARDETIKAQAGLLARGLWSEGAVHRPAWVQNQAPNAYGADDYLATSGTPGDQYAPSPWPPVDRRKIPRFGLGVPLAQNLDLMKKTNYIGLTYTHGVLAPPYTHEEALPNHIGLSVFQDSLALITAGMAEGWLECTTMPALVARERMEIPQEPPL